MKILSVRLYDSVEHDLEMLKKRYEGQSYNLIVNMAIRKYAEELRQQMYDDFTSMLNNYAGGD